MPPVTFRAVTVIVAGRKVRVVIDRDINGGYVAEVPACPGCVSQGDTLREVTLAIKEACAAWMLTAESSGDYVGSLTAKRNVPAKHTRMAKCHVPEEITAIDEARDIAAQVAGQTQEIAEAVEELRADVAEALAKPASRIDNGIVRRLALP